MHSFEIVVLGSQNNYIDWNLSALLWKKIKLTDQIKDTKRSSLDAIPLSAVFKITSSYMTKQIICIFLLWHVHLEYMSSYKKEVLSRNLI